MEIASTILFAIGTAMFVGGGRVWLYEKYLDWQRRRRCDRPRAANGRFV